MNDAIVSASSFEKALEVMCITPSQLPPDPLAPSCQQYRLRPSEEASILSNRYLNPPPPWGIKINLHRSFIGPEKCLQLARKMILNQTVTYLDLSMCDMEAQAAVEFFKYLEKNRTLKHLNVNGNRLKDDGACAAAKCISKLETLHIASNDVTDIGILAIADEVRISKSIKSLNVRNNHMTIYGLYKIMDALEPSFGLMPPDAQDFINAKEKEVSTLLFKSSSTPHEASIEDELLETVVEDSASTTGNSLKNILVFDAENTEKEENNDEDKESVERGKRYNETLHTLWVDYNCTFPEEILKSLNTILAKRFPLPPPGTIKKKKRKK